MSEDAVASVQAAEPRQRAFIRAAVEQRIRGTAQHG